MRLAHRLLHDPDIATVDRVAGSFVLLSANSYPESQRRHAAHDRGDSLSIRFRPGDAEIPQPLAGFVRAHLDAPRRHTSIAAPLNNTWLFPGALVTGHLTDGPFGLAAEVVDLVAGIVFGPHDRPFVWR